MKSSPQRTEERHRRSAALVDEQIEALFRRMPMLTGFALRHDLEVDHIAFHTWPGCTAGKELYEELLQALADLAGERPEAIDILRGRTFARALH